MLSFPGSTFGTHDEGLRAKVGGLSHIKRIAEAVALRSKVNDILKDGDTSCGVILLGDMNEVPYSSPLEILHGPGGSEIGTQGFNKKDSADYARLWDLSTCIPEQRRYSRLYENRKELIDHILVSEELLPVAGGKHTLPNVDSLVKNLQSISDDPYVRVGKPISDHAPLVAIFSLP